MIRVHRDLEQLPNFHNAVITIGTFDGVHTGHQQIIELLLHEATSIGGESVIITFYPHPRKVVQQGKPAIKVLSSLNEKIILLDKQGIQHLVVIPFDEAFAHQTAESYVEHFLVEKFHPKTIIIGYDHRFGNNRSGDYHLLETLGELFNYQVKEIPAHVLNEATVSSTRIRQALLANNVKAANEMLGYRYFFEGIVTEGNKLGRTIGYPTANLLIDDAEKLIPANGVYAVQVRIAKEETLHNGMMNIGLRPTIDDSKQTIEVHIFDFDQDIYGSEIIVYLAKYLRKEIKFSGLESLKRQLAEDAISAREILQ